MKVLQLIDTLNIGGAERMCVNIANVLQSDGIESYLIASRNTGSLQQFLSPAVQFATLNKKNSIDIPAFRLLIKKVRQIKPDVIHAHSTSIFWACGLKFLMPGLVIIWHDHYGLSDSIKSNGRAGLKFFSRWMDGVIAVNTVLAEWCKTNLHVDSKYIIFLKNFPFLSFSKEFKKSGKPVILNLANFRPQKDQLTLIEAANILKQKKIEFNLWLAGEYIDKEWLLLVQDKIRDLKLGTEIKILGPVADASSLLVQSSVGVLSSVSEGLPVALLEYGLAGLPVACTDTGHCKEVLGNGSFGFIVPPKDPVALAYALQQLIQNNQMATSLGESFKNQVINNYGAKNFLSGYLGLIKSILITQNDAKKSK